MLSETTEQNDSEKDLQNQFPRLNLCLVAQRFPVLGRATDHGFLWPIAKGLASHGHRVVVIGARSNLGRSEISRDGVTAYYLHDGVPQFAGVEFEEAAYEKFLSLHRTEPFDLVHCMDEAGARIAGSKKSLKIKVAYDVEATQMSQIFSILGMGQETAASMIKTGISVGFKFLTTFLVKDRDILKSADGIFVKSQEQRLFLERYYLYPDVRIHSVPYGLELNALGSRSEVKDLKSKINLPEHSQLVLTVTDMAVSIEIKNLLQAFEKVAIKKPNIYLVIIGQGPCWKEIEKELFDLALGSRVIMTGALKSEEISDWISVTDIFVNLSSRSNGYESSLFEAMAQRKIIIGSEMSPLAHVIEDGVDGFLLRPADILSLANIILEIFSGGIPVEDIKQKARQKVTELFDQTKMIRSIEEAYYRILGILKF